MRVWQQEIVLFVVGADSAMIRKLRDGGRGRASRRGGWATMLRNDGIALIERSVDRAQR